MLILNRLQHNVDFNFKSILTHNFYFDFKCIAYNKTTTFISPNNVHPL